MIKRIDHIAIAVRDLDRARAFFVDLLGGRELYSAPDPAQHFRWTTIELGTSCLIELIDPLGEEGFLHRFLEARGEGPHHVTIQVDDIRATRGRIEAGGVTTFGFSEALEGWKEFFIHPKEAFGTLIQFAEFEPLRWIQEGYVPAAYSEFVGETDGEESGEPLSVRRVRTDGRRGVEIRVGDRRLVLSEGRAAGLLRALREALSGEVPGDLADRP